MIKWELFLSMSCENAEHTKWIFLMWINLKQSTKTTRKTSLPLWIWLTIQKLLSLFVMWSDISIKKKGKRSLNFSSPAITEELKVVFSDAKKFPCVDQSFPKQILLLMQIIYIIIYIYIYIVIVIVIYIVIYPSVCLSVCLSAYPSICLSVYLSICLSVYLSIYLYLFEIFKVFVKTFVIRTNVKTKTMKLLRIGPRRVWDLMLSNLSGVKCCSEWYMGRTVHHLHAQVSDDMEVSAITGKKLVTSW